MNDKGGSAPSVLAVHRYYWPDAPPYASMLRVIVERWRQAGFETEVFSTQPSYRDVADVERRPKREVVDGTPVHRVGLPRGRHTILRAVNMVLFALATFVRVVMRRRDVVMCSTSPPVILGAAASLGARLRGAAFIYHCMDLHPEIGALAGDFRNRYVLALLDRLDKATCRRASAVVVLSEDMRNSLLRRDASLADRIVVLNNFDLPDLSDRSSQAGQVAIPVRERFRLVFTGNLGRFQGLETIVDGAMALRHEVEFDLIFMGDGVAKADLERQVASLDDDGLVSIQFLPQGSPSEARQLMRTADLGLVTLTPGIIQYAYPSKTMTYLSEGLPLLVAAELDSELGRTVVNERLGFAVPPMDSAAISNAIRMAANKPTDLAAMKRNARVYASAHFGREQALSQWARLLRRVISDEG